MKKKLGIALGLVLLCGGAAITVFATRAEAKPPINCPDVWIPVICSDGQIYSNYCYASQAGATGCVPWGQD